MASFLRFAVLLTLAPLVTVNGISRALSKLELRDVNFVHTSDIHAWFRGHRKDDALSRSWSGDMGDVVSFVEHMKTQAESQGKDLFFIDTGDATHGGGLSDADKPEGSKALAIQSSLPYDVMTAGNHELEIRNISANYYSMWNAFQVEKKSTILGSNLFYKDDAGQVVRVGAPYRVWTTRNGKGRKVAALGVSFENKKTKDADVLCQSISKMVQEDWFVKEFLGSNPDLFLLAGHMSLRDADNKWQILHDAIRARYPMTPIFMFGGHSHNRDCRMDFDVKGRSIAIESGRYLETVGWVSANLQGDINFVRRFLDPSKETFARHAGVAVQFFDTPSGKDVTARFNALYSQLDLDAIYGCSPKTYDWDHLPYSRNSDNHVLAFYLNEVFPKVVAGSDPYYLLLNNGFMRGPIYKGALTEDDIYVNTPYKQRFAVSKVPKVIADKVLFELDRFQEEETKAAEASLAAAPQEVFAGDSTPGYITNDGCMALGPADDVRHTAPGLKITYPPPYVHSSSPQTAHLPPTALVDFVTISRLEARVFGALDRALEAYNQYCRDWRLCEELPKVPIQWTRYSDIDSSEAVKVYAQRFWKQPSKFNPRC